MSYVPVSVIPMRLGDGTLLVTAEVPVEDIADTIGERALQIWPLMLSQAVATVDTYANATLWPAIRAEVDRATSQAEQRTMELGKTAAKTTAVVGALVLGMLGAAFFMMRRANR